MIHNPVHTKQFEAAIEYAVSRLWRWRGCTSKFDIVKGEVKREYPKQHLDRVMYEAKDRYYNEKLR